jgi:hypothetical protein
MYIDKLAERLQLAWEPFAGTRSTLLVAAGLAAESGKAPSRHMSTAAFDRALPQSTASRGAITLALDSHDANRIIHGLKRCYGH